MTIVLAIITILVIWTDAGQQASRVVQVRSADAFTGMRPRTPRIAGITVITNITAAIVAHQVPNALGHEDLCQARPFPTLSPALRTDDD